jgi:hypothetical protein
MSRMKRHALMTLMLGGIFSGFRRDNDLFGEVKVKRDPFNSEPLELSQPPSYRQLPPLPKVIPNGCKVYFFNAEGGFSNRHMLKTEVVYQCVASSDKKAKEKFQKWGNKKEA